MAHLGIPTPGTTTHALMDRENFNKHINVAWQHQCQACSQLTQSKASERILIWIISVNSSSASSATLVVTVTMGEMTKEIEKVQPPFPRLGAVVIEAEIQRQKHGAHQRKPEKRQVCVVQLED